MVGPREVRHEHAGRLVRARGAAGGGGDHHPWALPLTLRRVVVHVAADCSLCQAAVETVEEALTELPFELEIVDIGGDPALERSYRELLPVVTVDGRVAFTHFVEPAAFRVALRD